MESLRNGEFHNVYSSLSRYSASASKYMRIRWTGYVARIGMGYAYEILVRKSEGQVDG
jgi:hypothetical protein